MSARTTGAVNFDMVSLDAKAKTTISENQFRFSHSWYWTCAEPVPALAALFPEDFHRVVSAQQEDY
jgi:hypothetical protein